MGICPGNRIFLQQSCRQITLFGASGFVYRLANDQTMMNRPPSAVAPVEKKEACFENHFKLLFLLNPCYSRADGHSYFKTANPFRQAAKSIYLIPPIFGKQNTGAVRPDDSAVRPPLEVFRRQRISDQTITTQPAKLISEHPERYIQTK